MKFIAWVADSLRTLLWQSAYADSQASSMDSFLPAPDLSISPARSIFSRGEKVMLICSLPERQRETEYDFYKMEANGHWSTSRLPGENTFEVSTRCLGPNETFACSYLVENVAGGRSQSLWSKQVVISITEIPHAATLSLHPHHPVYIKGEQVNLTCVIPAGQQVARIVFRREPQDQTFKELLPKKGVNSYETVIVQEETAGNYVCAYWTLLSGQKIQSPRSNLVSIAMIDPPPPPVLKVDPPSRVVNKGNPLTITCSAKGNNTEKRFSFYRDGVEMNSSNEESLSSSLRTGDASQAISLKILQAKPNHTGEFACRYEEKVSSRWLPSPCSQKMNITVVASNSSTSFLAYACLAFPLLILMLLLAFYCWRKKNVLFNLQTSKSQQESEPGENKEKIVVDNLGLLELQKTALQVKDSDITYATLTISAETPSGPVMEKGLPPMEEKGVLYSEILFQRTNKTAK